MMKRSLFVLMILTVLFSCKKDHTESTPKTAIQYLTQKPWYATTVLRRIDEVEPWQVNDYSNTRCVIDNKTTFNTDLTYTVDEGTTKCNSLDPQTLEAGTFSFANNETHLTVITNVGFILTEDWTIEQLDENVFTYTF